MKWRGYTSFLFGLIVFLVIIPISIQKAKQAQASENREFAFVNVTIIPMDKERIIEGQTVIVRDGKINQLGPAFKTSIPEGAERIDGKGKYLIPGLVDMHVHLKDIDDNEMSALLQLYVVNGVTTVLNLSGIPRHLEIRKKVAEGTLFGPTIYTSGPYVSSVTGSSPTPEEVERAVIEQKRAGYDIIKIHGDFTREAYRRLFVIARREGMRVIGHAPRNLGIEAMLEERQDAVAHAEEYIYDKNSTSRDFADIEPKIPVIARATARAGTWVVPNLTAFKNVGLQVADMDAVLHRAEMRYVPPGIVRLWGSPTNPYSRLGKEQSQKIQARYKVLEKLTKGFRDAGVRLLAGTDAMNPCVVPGFSLHDELRDLVGAGLTPYEALRASTSNAAEFLKGDREFGTIAVGKRADLILVDGNRLENVAFAQRIEGVMIRGRWLSRPELQKKLDELVASYGRDR